MNASLNSTRPHLLQLPNISTRGALSFLLALLAVALCLVPELAFAADAGPGGGSGLQWEGPIARIRDSISGPIAFAIALLGIVVCGAMLIWGGEISEFVRRLIMLVLVICLIVFANSILTGALFAGAMVPDVAIQLDAVATAYQARG